MIALALLLGLHCATPAVPAAAPWTIDEVFAALREVETGGCPDGGRRARGDGGAALGPYQIHRAYWLDARVAGAYEQCRDADYSRSVVLAYWRRWCPRALEAVDAEVLARVHNGGPRGLATESTRGYWRRVERALVEARARREPRPVADGRDRPSGFSKAPDELDQLAEAAAPSGVRTSAPAASRGPRGRAAA